MTASNYMERDELLKMAALDVFGLLDEYEAERYNRSFHNAPAGVQDEIVALQAELASDTSLLPDEYPDPSLRERVLKRVAKAVEEEATLLAPIATIGRNRKSVDVIDTTHGRLLLRASRFWRAACFVLAASLVATLFMYAEAYKGSSELAAEFFLKHNNDKFKELLGPDIQDFLYNDKNVATGVFKSATGKYEGTATIHYNKITNSAFFLAPELAKNRRFILRAVKENQEEPVEVYAFTTKDEPYFNFRLDNLKEEHGIGSLAAVTWEIFDTVTKTVILTTAT